MSDRWLPLPSAAPASTTIRFALELDSHQL
jgi:hypothetical protein